MYIVYFLIPSRRRKINGYFTFQRLRHRLPVAASASESQLTRLTFLHTHVIGHNIQLNAKTDQERALSVESFPRQAEQESPSSGNGPLAVIIGAGIVGICSANYLLRAGYRVQLVDPLEPGSPDQCSYGNSGIISTGTFVPAALPGLVQSIPKMLLDPEGPLSLRPSYFPKALPWLLRFVMSSRENRAREIAAALFSISRLTYDCYEPLLREAGCEDLLQARGALILYEDEIVPQKEDFGLRLRREYGIPMDVLNGQQLHEMEPSLGPTLKRAILLTNARHCPNPGRLVATLAAHAFRQGAALVRGKVVGFDFGQGGVASVRTEGGRRLPCDHVVLAAGSRSGPLAKMLGTPVPIEHERGYHIMVPYPEQKLGRAAVSAERKMTITPMEEGLRFSGTEEFAGADAPPNPRRTDILRRGAKLLFPGLDTSKASTWMGRRPGMPDSKPVIERSRKHGNVVFAFGHGHQGMIGGAVTGQLVTQIIAGEPTLIDLSPFRAGRF